jgi:hypothetical protein
LGGGRWAVVGWACSGFAFVEFDDFCEFDGVWVVVVVDGFVEEFGQDWCEVGSEVSDYRGFDLVYV